MVKAMSKKKHSAALALIIALLAAMGTLTVNAVTPYNSYNYDSGGNAVQTPDIYEPDFALSGSLIGVGEFAEPADMYADGDDLYILDSGNSRIVVYNTKDGSAKEISVKNGSDTAELKKAAGIYTADGIIYVADSGNQCVWCINGQGEAIKKITKPKSEYFSSAAEFLPQKITGDSVGNLYVQCTGIYEGLAIFDAEYAFKGFFAGERVETTSQILQSYFWKQFMTKEQREAMSNYVPTEILNMDMSEDNFLYSVTPGRIISGKGCKETIDSIRCLNPKGTDILENGMPAKVKASFEADSRYLNFVDIVYGNDGFISIIDNRRGRICQFDENMRLITAFGGIGSYVGTFSSPCAVEEVNGRLAVLDSQKCNITFFSLTETGKKVHNALKLYNSGSYSESLEPWKEVIEENPEFQLAYIGIGNALFNEGSYREAMKYYELGKYSEGYSNAFHEYRVEAMRNGYLILFAVIAAVAAVIVLLRLYRKKRAAAGKKALADYSGGGLMLYSVFHPFNGFDEMRTKKKGTLWFALAVTVLLVILGIAEQQYFGKAFVMAEEGKTNILIIAAVRIAVVLIFVISNWAFSVLLDGKATFLQICFFTSVTLVPYIGAGLLRVILSHFLTVNEGVFLSLILAVGIIWSFAVLMSAFSVFHEYEIGKSILILIVTLIGMLLIAVLMFLMYNLVQNVLETVKTVFSEIVFRINT